MKMDQTSEWVEALQIDAAHPSLPGHFPGQPVVPGVVLLDRVAAFLQRVAGVDLRRLPAVKFLSPLLPGQVAKLHVAIIGARARFRIVRDETVILSGEAEFT